MMIKIQVKVDESQHQRDFCSVFDLKTVCWTYINLLKPTVSFWNVFLLEIVEKKLDLNFTIKKTFYFVDGSDN